MSTTMHLLLAQLFCYFFFPFHFDSICAFCCLYRSRTIVKRISLFRSEVGALGCHLFLQLGLTAFFHSCFSSPFILSPFDFVILFATARTQHTFFPLIIHFNVSGEFHFANVNSPTLCESAASSAHTIIRFLLREREKKGKFLIIRPVKL